jgi:hypothetical protein
MSDVRTIELDNPSAMLGTLSFQATTKQEVIDYYVRRYGREPEAVYVWRDSKQIPQYCVVIR